MSSNNLPSDHDLLVKLHAKFDSLWEEFRRVSNGTGFPRCAERLGKLDNLENQCRALHKRIDALTSRCWWAITVAVTSMLGFISATLLYLVQGAMKN